MSSSKIFRQRKSLALSHSKRPQLTVKKFCLFMSFAAFATHLVYLGELTQIKYTAVRNKSVHYSQFVEDYLHSSNKSELIRNRTRVMTAYYATKNQAKEPELRPPPKRVTKVLLVSSNPRSGSSFTGELLTAMPNVSYFFEPLWFFSRPNKSEEAKLSKKIAFVGKLLDCRYKGLRKVMNNMKAREFVFKKPQIGSTNFRTLPLLSKNNFITSIEEECRKTDLRVTKLFRLRIEDILPEMKNERSPLGPDFKVILLQRDPRATINSLREEIQEWLPGASSPKKICGTMLRDYSTVAQIKDQRIRQRIMVVKFEDIASKPSLMAAQLYGFLNRTTRRDLECAQHFFESHVERQSVSGEKAQLAANLSKQALQMSLIQRKIRYEAKWRHGQLSRAEFEKTVQNASYVPHMDSTEERENRLHKYYGTFRPINFRHDHWRNELQPQVLKDIQGSQECQQIFELLSYDL